MFALAALSGLPESVTLNTFCVSFSLSDVLIKHVLYLVVVHRPSTLGCSLVGFSSLLLYLCFGFGRSC